MIGKPTRQLNLVNSVFTNRKKRSHSDKMLQKINDFVDWSILVKEIKKLYKSSDRGRPSIPIEYMIKILLLQYLYNLSDPAMEDALIDRLSFQCFVGQSFSDEVPDFTTVWRFRERLVKANILEKLDGLILEMIERKGVRLKTGRIAIVDATIVSPARKAPKGKDARSCQKDYDARATKKGKKGYFGYKGHVGMDKKTGLLHHVAFTPAQLHDSQKFEELLTSKEKAAFGDKAYASVLRKRAFRKQGIYYGILDKSYRSRSLSGRQKRRNKRNSQIRKQVERVFAHLKKWYGYAQVRYVNYARDKLQFLLLCMLYNVRRAISFQAV